jgi:thymidylate synthase (FAD)
VIDILEGVNREVKIGDHGLVFLVDCMPRVIKPGQTMDHAILRAARTSYGNSEKEGTDAENRGLIRYLMRHVHTTPVEFCVFQFYIALPIFVARQLVRHRMCLSGDTQLVFVRPCDERAYRMDISEVFRKWQPTSGSGVQQRDSNPHFLRERVQAMKLRSINERTGEVYFTNIVDIWQSGVKHLFRIEIEGGRSVRASKDHLFFTPTGWKKLEELSVGHAVKTISSRVGTPAAKFNEIDSEAENWRPIVGWEDYYQISDQGRVRRIVGGQGSRSHGRCKAITVSNERAVTSLNRPGYQVVIHIHREILRSFVGEPEPKMEACHRNGNSLDNRLENLYWGTSKQNSEDMIAHGRNGYLTGQDKKIISIEPDGEEMTYDIEVSGPWHNFSANDFVVHNSTLNEYSLRYSEPKEQCYIPAENDVRQQSKTNKQGTEGQVDYAVAETFREVTRETFENAYGQYKTDIRNGIGREQARFNLPLSTFTFWVWKIDLHNLFRTLSLRMDKHAQKEIRDYGEALHALVKDLAPWAFEAWQDYDVRRDAMLLTGPEVEFLNRDEDEIESGPHLNTRVTMREQEEFVAKLKRLGMTEQAGRLSDWIKAEKDCIKKEKEEAEKKQLIDLKPF